MREKNVVAVLGLVLLGTTGCATMRVGSDYDREVSFAGLRTYAWAAAPEGEVEETARVNPFIQRRLERAIDDELAARGFVPAEGDEADLLISASVVRAESATEGGRGDRIGFPLMLGFSFGYAPAIWAYPWGWPYGWASPYGDYRGYPTGSRFYRYGYRPYFGWPTTYFGWPTTAGYGAWYGGRRPSDLGALPPGSFVIDVMDGATGELVWEGWARGALAYAPGQLDALPRFIQDAVHRILEDFPPDGR